MDNNGQISIEMLLIAGALFAVSLFVIGGLFESSDEAKTKMTGKVTETLKKIDELGSSSNG